MLRRQPPNTCVVKGSYIVPVSPRGQHAAHFNLQLSKDQIEGSQVDHVKDPAHIHDDDIGIVIVPSKMKNKNILSIAKITVQLVNCKEDKKLMNTKNCKRLEEDITNLSNIEMIYESHN